MKVVPDIIDGIYLFYESCTTYQECRFFKLSEFHLRAVFGIMLTSVPIMSIVASFIYLYATSISNAALLKDSIVILFLSEIDEQTFKVIVRLFPAWNDKIEQDIFDHHYDIVTSDLDNDKSANKKAGEDASREDDDTVKIMTSGAKKDSEDLSKYSTSEDLIGITKCPEIKKVLQKSCNDDRIDALTFQVEKLISQVHAKDLIILQMWNVLSREHFQFTDSAINKSIDVYALNADTDLPEINHHMKKETQHLEEVEGNTPTNNNDSECSPLISFQLNKLSVRQAEAQELDTKIKDTFQNTHCSRRSSLDIFEDNEVHNSSPNTTSNINGINRSKKHLDKSKNSSLVAARKEAEASRDNDSKSYPLPSLDTPHPEVAPSNYAKSDDNFLSKGKIISHPDPSIIDDSCKNEEKSEYQEINYVDNKTKKHSLNNTEKVDDKTNTTCLVDQSNMASLSKETSICDSGLLFHSLDLELNVNNPGENNAVFMNIDERDSTFDITGSLKKRIHTINAAIH